MVSNQFRLNQDVCGWVKKIKTSATVSTETARWIDIADSQRVKGVTEKATTTLIQFIYTTY